MVEKVQVTVRASGSNADVLTVEDAMRQVLDIFRLLSASAVEEIAFSWKLAKASTNSPFFLEGEAVSLAPNASIEDVARRQKQAFAAGMTAYQQGEAYEPWIAGRQGRIAEALFKRNMNGIGFINIDLGQDLHVAITPKTASVAVEAMNRKSKHELLYTFDPTNEHGAFEGVLQDLGTHYNHPSVGVVDRRTGFLVWCHLTEELQQRLGQLVEYRNFWRKQRVVVRGRINRNAQGHTTWVSANDIEKVTETLIEDVRLHDANFTSGMPIGKYLETFRDGELA